MRTFLAFVFAFAAVAQEAPKLRLPADVRPLGYDLDLRLVPATDVYSGTIGVDVEILKPVSTVWLNSSGLELGSASIAGQSARVVPGGREFAGLAVDAPLKTGRARIQIEFSGKFNRNDVEGLFKQMDRGDAYVFTQFEPTSARRAFPCFDEPMFKTPWRLTLRVPKDLKAFANTPVANETIEGDLKVVRFAPSKPLPSYLVAMAVGPFDVVDVGRAGRKRIPVRTLALKGRAAETKYTNEVTPKIVAALEDYFGIPYPYEKLDQITIPITVGFGAMENAGLITYQQGLLLSKPEEDTVGRQRGSASVIAHELAHQWFGNMVTPAWWDDIWLNEAFATWMANRIVDGLFPQWQSKASAASSKAAVMGQDGLLSARRIRQPIEKHGDIGNAFDGITYQKGSAVIRMFENYVGAAKFQRGVRGYMKKHAWGAATANDFLAAISAGAGQNIAPAFSKFLDRGGLPLVTVELKCDNNKPRLAVTQERSLPIGSKGSRTEYWSVPVCLRYEANGKVVNECHVVSDPRDEVPLKGCPEWINANANASGYYHLLYKGDLANKLVARKDQLALHEKVDLLNNALALVRGGHMPASDAMGLAREFRAAPERQIVSASLSIVESVSRSVPASMKGRYAKLIRELFGQRARELGWMPKPGESDDDRLLRSSLLPTVAIDGEDSELAAEAKTLAMKWLDDRKAVPNDIAGDVLSIAAHHGDAALYERLVAEMKKSNVRRDRGRMVGAIASFRDPVIAGRALSLLMGNEFDVRELLGLLGGFKGSEATEKLAWNFVRENYDQLLPRLPSRLGTGGGTVLPMAAGGFCTTEDYVEVESFFRDRIKTISGGDRALAGVLERIQLCEARRKAQSPEIERYLRTLGD